MRGQIVLNMQVRSLLIQTVDACMGSNPVRHVVEVIGPHVEVILVLYEQLHTDTVDIGFGAVVVNRRATGQKLRCPVGFYEINLVSHFLPEYANACPYIKDMRQPVPHIVLFTPWRILPPCPDMR